MQRTGLGSSDIEVSAIGMGCWGIVGDETWGPQDETDAYEAMKEALDCGITLFDTAEAYGDGYSEQLLGNALSGIRDDAIIATKASASHHAPEELRAACERSLRRLGTDYIDVYQLHWPSREVGFEETWEAMGQLKQEGKIRAGGVSNFGKGDLGSLLSCGRPVSNQLCYNLLFRAIEYEILPLCVEHDIGVMTYSSIMWGLLTGKFASADDVPAGRARTRHFSKDRPRARHSEQGAESETFAAIERIRAIAERAGESMADVSMAWLLAQDGVDTVLVGIRNPDQARKNARAGELELSDEIVAELAEVTEEVKEKLGANADTWQTESRIR